MQEPSCSIRIIEYIIGRKCYTDDLPNYYVTPILPPISCLMHMEVPGSDVCLRIEVWIADRKLVQ